MRALPFIALALFACAGSTKAPVASPTDDAPPTDVEEHKLAPGDPAPDFTIAAHDGKDVTLSSLRGKPVVLYFYPKDETPG